MQEDDKITPQVSVIVPIYNTREFLPKCIQSVLEQSFSNWELILSDDGSTDGSIELCKKYERKDKRIHVLQNQHGGVSTARNVAIENARGTYITFLDSDDWLELDFLSKAVSICEEYALDMYLAGMVRVSNGAIIRRGVIEEEICEYSNKLTEKQLIELIQSNYIASSCGKLYHRKIIEDVRFDTQMNFGEDLTFVINLLEKPIKLLAVGQVVYNYRAEGESLTSIVNKRKCESMVKLYKILFEEEKRRGFKDKEYLMFISQRKKNDFQYIKDMILEGEYSYREKRGMLKILLQGDASDLQSVPNKKESKRKKRNYIHTEVLLLKRQLIQWKRKYFAKFLLKR